MEKYEKTFIELDGIFRKDERDKMIYEFKKLNDKQLKEIIRLKKELEKAKLAVFQSESMSGTIGTRLSYGGGRMTK